MKRQGWPMEKKLILILSLDSDVKLLGIFFSSKCDSLEMVIKSGTGMIPVFFSPRKVVDYMRNMQSQMM